MTLRIGMIGLGDIAQKVYLPLLSTNSNIEIAGVMSTTQRTVDHMMQQYRLPFGTTNISQLFERNLDAMFIHSPTPSHYELVMACLAKQIPVYVDKPLSYDLHESQAMAAMAEEKGVLLGVGFNRRFAPRYIDAKQWIEQNGGFEWCAIQKHRTRQQNHHAKQSVYDDLIHILDMMLWLGGTRYELGTHSLRIDNDGKMRSASGFVNFGEAEGSYSMVRKTGFDLEKLEVYGHGRSAEVVNMENAVFYEAGTRPEQLYFGSWDTVLHRRGFEGAVNHFLSNLNTPEQCSIRADLVMESHVLAERISSL
ncbi:dehydrogenase [Paenibacillus selenitireducens]|uniref:Dehydrogenase n=1 Tax=Paenibacillus selenitireducens TaxID=1324314 RepID=A0A1T2X437_9BACL|nr:Gfo/Idh/MocA family oxidoreductase [Paenibacillus selenitireducens]OPA74617.1 dehydrogenase [Paenibacillus selenitireducens]